MKPPSHFRFCAVPWRIPESMKNRTGADEAARKAKQEWDVWRKAQDRKAVKMAKKRAAKRVAKRIAQREARTAADGAGYPGV